MNDEKGKIKKKKKKKTDFFQKNVYLVQGLDSELKKVM